MGAGFHQLLVHLSMIPSYVCGDIRSKVLVTTSHLQTSDLLDQQNLKNVSNRQDFRNV